MMLAPKKGHHKRAVLSPGILMEMFRIVKMHLTEIILKVPVFPANDATVLYRRSSIDC